MKEWPGVTQTNSHCGHRDQKPNSDFVLNRATHYNCEEVILISTKSFREEKKRINLEEHFREECWGRLMAG
jgi:hypothetical protein